MLFEKLTAAEITEVNLLIGIKHNIFRLDVAMWDIVHPQAVVYGWNQTSKVAFDLSLFEAVFRFVKFLEQCPTLTEVHDQIHVLTFLHIDNLIELDNILVN